MSKFEGYRLGDAVWIADQISSAGMGVHPWAAEVLFVMKDGERLMVLVGGVSKILTENAVFMSRAEAEVAIKELREGRLTRADLFLLPCTE